MSKKIKSVIHDEFGDEISVVHTDTAWDAQYYFEKLFAGNPGYVIYIEAARIPEPAGSCDEVADTGGKASVQSFDDGRPYNEPIISDDMPF